MGQKLYPLIQVRQSDEVELNERQLSDLPLLETQAPFCRVEPKAQDKQFPPRSTLTQYEGYCQQLFCLR
jgi:hypothetical protein